MDEHDLTVALAAVPRSAAQARRALETLLFDRGVNGEIKDFAVLVVSELVTNAIRHGREPIAFRAQVTDQLVRIEVSDSAASLGGDVNDPGPWSTSGRGLAIVEAVSREWGVDWHGDAGKTVWADLEAPM